MTTRERSTGPVVVIGIDNIFRRDDGVASAVLTQAGPRLAERARVVRLDGEPGRVVEQWTGTALTVVIDAMRAGVAPGTVHRLAVEDLPSSTMRGGTHSAGLAEAVELGRALDRLPRCLVVYGVEGADFSEGVGLSDPVRRAVPDVVDQIVRDVDDLVAGLAGTGGTDGAFLARPGKDGR